MRPSARIRHESLLTCGSPTARKGELASLGLWSTSPALNGVTPIPVNPMLVSPFAARLPVFDCPANTSVRLGGLGAVAAELPASVALGAAWQAASAKTARKMTKR